MIEDTVADMVAVDMAAVDTVEGIVEDIVDKDVVEDIVGIEADNLVVE